MGHTGAVRSGVTHFSVLCQCPKQAYTISASAPIAVKANKKGCQCPKRAYSVSTQAIEAGDVELQMCQCPKWAYSISALPFYTP